MPILLLVLLLGLTACHPAPRVSPFSDLPQPPFDAAVQAAPSTAEALAFRAFIAAGLSSDLGEHEAAVASLEQAIILDPASPALRLRLAEEWLQLGNDEAATRAAEDALIQDGRYLPALLFLGNIHFNRGDSARAVEYYERALTVNPEKDDIVLHLAIAAARLGDYPRAVEVLKELVRKRPELVIAELALSRLYRDMNLPLLAEETLRSLMKRRPDLDAPYLELAAISEGRGEHDKALALLRDALTRNPDNMVARHHLARLLIVVGQLDKALAELGEIVRRNPDDLEARRKIGLIHLEQKRWPEAITAFSAILERDGDLEQVRFYLGTARERQEDFAAALADFAGIGTDSELYEDALAHRAYLLHRLQRKDEAVALIEEQFARGRGRVSLYLYLATLYESGDDFAQARSTYERARSLYPQEAEVGYKFALFQDRRGEREGALAAMRGVLHLDPDHAEALNFIAYAHAEAGTNLDEALDMAQRALKLKPQGHIRDTLGWVYFRRGELTKARELLEAAAAQLNDDPVVIEHLGDVMRALGLPRKAAELYQRSLDLDPRNSELERKFKQLGVPREQP